LTPEIDKFNPVALWDEDGQDPYNVDPCMTGAMVKVPEGRYVRLKDHLQKLDKAETVLKDIRDICEDFPEGIPADHVKNIKAWINTHIGRCDKCDDTGDVHRIDGEWLGRCDCPAGRHKT